MGRAVAIVIGLALALGVAGCGGSSSSAVKTPPAGTAAGTTATTPTGPAGVGQRSGNVAVIVNQPLSQATFDHWMFIAAKIQASQNRGSPVVVPTDPPGFSACAAQARKQVPSLASSAPATLKADCQQLFRSLGSQTLAFLIQAGWYQALAAADHVVITSGEVQQAYAKQKAQQFRTAGAFQAFLRSTGQTTQDLLFRFRLNLIVMRLSALEGGQSKLAAKARSRYRSQTRCAPLYRVSTACGS